MDTPAVRCVGLRQTFGDHVAVDGLDLAPRAGEVFGLLGPNGAGKTTTIRVITTLLPAPPGTVEVRGLDVARRKRLGAAAARLRAPAAVRRRGADRPGERRAVRPALRRAAPRAGRAVAGVLGAMGLADAADRLRRPTPAA